MTYIATDSKSFLCFGRTLLSHTCRPDGFHLRHTQGVERLCACEWRDSTITRTGVRLQIFFFRTSIDRAMFAALPIPAHSLFLFNHFFISPFLRGAYKLFTSAQLRHSFFLLFRAVSCFLIYIAPSAFENRSWIALKSTYYTLRKHEEKEIEIER